MRTKNSLLNLLTAFLGQAAGIVISFIARKLFVQILSSEYLGLNGLFSNILTLLSLAELGVGSAIIFSLYKPLAEEDTDKIKSLMHLYKKAYNLIGILIMLLGICFLPFYRFLINDIPDIAHLNVIYLLFVVNTAVSYFYSYKRSLIICDQKRYIATIYRYTFYFAVNIAQIIILYLTQNYILYLIIQVIFTWMENICVSKKADKMYPYLKEKDIMPLPEEDKMVIKRNISAMIRHKLGGMVVNSTDNIIISKFVGLSAVGIYSNYYLVINALQMIVNQIFNAVVASVGNLGAIENKNKLYNIFKSILFMNFVIMTVMSNCLLAVFNDFINLWLGVDYLFDFKTVLVIVICLYLWGIRKTCLTFREALGLYWHDRNKPIIESVINIVASIILVNKYGVYGVFVGTIISTVATSLWIEPCVLYNYGFGRKSYDYFKKLIIYISHGTAVILITQFVTNIISGDNFVYFLIKILTALLCGIMLSILPYMRTEEFLYYVDILKRVLNKVVRSKDGK